MNKELPFKEKIKNILLNGWTTAGATDELVKLFKSVITECKPKNLDIDGDPDASEFDQEWIKGKQFGHNESSDNYEQNLLDKLK